MDRVLPTIVSRCQLISTPGETQIDAESLNEFLKLDTADKLLFLTKIKDRKDAQEFVLNLTLGLHKTLLADDIDRLTVAKNLKITQETFAALKTNGNVTLQLSNMAINIA